MVTSKANISGSVGVLVRRRRDDGKWEYLFVVRPDGTLGLPAGHRQNETARQCGEREFEEETGYQVHLTGIWIIVTIFDSEECGDNVTSEGVILAGELGDRIGDGEHEIRWITVHEFIELLLQGRITKPPYHLSAMFEANSGREPFPLEAILNLTLPKKVALPLDQEE